MDAASSPLVPTLVSTLLFTFVLIVLYIWVKHLIITLLCSGRHANQNVTSNRHVTENSRGSIEESHFADRDGACPPKTGSVREARRKLSAQAPHGTHLPSAQNGSSNQPPGSSNSTTTLTRHFGWPLEPMRIDHDPPNQDAGGLVEGGGIHLQLYINAARTIITGANFSSVTKTGEQADADKAN